MGPKRAQTRDIFTQQAAGRRDLDHRKSRFFTFSEPVKSIFFATFLFEAFVHRFAVRQLSFFAVRNSNSVNIVVGDRKKVLGFEVFCRNFLGESCARFWFLGETCARFCATPPRKKGGELCEILVQTSHNSTPKHISRTTLPLFFRKKPRTNLPPFFRVPKSRTNPP